MTDIKAIETHYGGYRFRSRLEARWAHFFTQTGWKWHYEPQGYHMSTGNLYLPDFWIESPELFFGGMWVEVKGKITEQEYVNLAIASNELPFFGPASSASFRADVSAVPAQPRMLLLGNVPDGKSPWVHPSWWWIPERKDTFFTYAMFCEGPDLMPCSALFPASSYHSEIMPDGFNINFGSFNAYALARQKRFEHGENE